MPRSRYGVRTITGDGVRDPGIRPPWRGNSTNAEVLNSQLAHHQWEPCPLCSYLKHDLAWSMACGAMLEGFARMGER